MNNVIVGKRVPIGAAINSVGVIFAAFYPENAIQIMAGIIPLTFTIQVMIVNYWGITLK